ncbi:MAG TPA: hypothetical protein PK263_05940, partial [bacterium]|nr:hypothetical protein [bacterium]
WPILICPPLAAFKVPADSIDRIPYEIQLLTLSKSRKKNTISIKYFNKEFEFCATQVTEKEIKALLEKYLIDSSEKKRFIKDSLKYFKETKEILFSSADDEHRSFSLDCITTYILEFECSILNNYLHEKSQNTAFYKSHMEGNPLFKLDHLLLSTTLFEAIFTGPINPITGFFQHFWLEYLDKLNEDHSQQNEKEKQRKLKELLIKAKDLVDPNLETSNVVLQKKKLPCYNYLFAALLHEKARHTGDDFVRLCREAADMYIDRSGKEFTGEQLANVFHSTVKNYGGWPGFYQQNKEKIKKLKKKVNWQD